MTDDDQDPTQLVPPHVDSGWQIKGFDASSLAFGIPGVLVALVGFALLIGFQLVVPALVLIGVGALLIPVGIVFAAQVGKYSSSIDQLKGPLTFLLRGRDEGHEEATAIHGVKRIHEDGTAEMQDGRIATIARIKGRNTDLQETEESRPMIGRLRQAFDDRVDFDFQLYSTTAPFDPEELTEKYREQWLADTYASEEWKPARALLKNIIDWEEQMSKEAWQAREWQHYVVVQVDPDDVDLPDVATTDEDTGRSVGDWIDWLLELWLGVDRSSSDDEQGEHWQARRSRMQRKASRRRRHLREAFSKISGVETRNVEATEHALLLTRFWAGTEHEIDPAHVTEDVNASVWPHHNATESHQPEAVKADETAKPTAVADVEQVEAVADGGTQAETTTTATNTAHNDPADAHADQDDAANAGLFAQIREGLFNPGSSGGSDDETEGSLTQPNRIQDLLAPEQYKEPEDLVVAGDQYCRTFWIGAWPTEPKEKFLQDLYTLRGVDVDVSLRMQSLDRDYAIDEVKHEIGSIDANINERKQDANDLEALLMEDEIDPYVQMLKLLRHSNAQPWKLSGYVTVRAGTRRALEEAEDLVEEDLVQEDQLTMDIAKRRALESACEKVTTVLESSPANLTLLSPSKRQGQLFESASPNGRNAYAEASHRQRRALTLSGTIAAAFPPTSKYIRQDDGMEHGRSTTNGSVVTADPFDPGPGHKLTGGDSGSGKTTGALKQAIRWKLADPERTLIFCDTVGDFGPITDLLNGAHITLDGDTTINPLHMEETPEEALEAGVKPFEMKFRQVTGLVLDIIAGSSTDIRERFKPLVKDAVRETLKDAGIKPGHPDTHKPERSPTMADFRETVKDMGNNPDEYVETEKEKMQIEDNAGPLLRRIKGFSEDGEYASLTGESDARIQPGSITYLDLQQIEGLGSAADESTMLNLMLGQVYEAVKRAPDKTMFVIDEAHYLLESKEMLQWLQQAARHWRHYNAGLWFLSQHPNDFVEDEDEDKRKYKEAIRGQVNTVELYATEDLSDEAAEEYGLNDRQAHYLRDKATAGQDGLGYTDCLVNYTEIQGWMRVEVRLSPLEQTIYTHNPDEDGPFDDYLADEWGEF
ncbi:VirB4 family type IV secretion system protein [Halomicrococcus sp. NG-SE-24]|uniref:VirB4 family type IV secretion system protein n=1 Tax=Halomicrococcus sp. NG-SE-24 TaxID=3436928 RepID=UPI003D98404E